VEGRAVCETADLFSFAQAKMAVAPLLPVGGGHAPISELRSAIEAAERLTLILTKLAATPEIATAA
jgi:hypothetical protein